MLFLMLLSMMLLVFFVQNLKRRFRRIGKVGVGSPKHSRTPHRSYEGRVTKELNHHAGFVLLQREVLFLKTMGTF
jgi:hypothetical protein